MAWWKLSLLVLAGCAHSAPALESSGPTLELRLDDGKPAEKPLLPERANEMLMRFDPNLDGYSVLSLKFLLAAPGHVMINLYKTSPEGNPGERLARVERDYPASFVSDGKDGRWVLERVPLPTLHGPLWVGLSGKDASLWTSAHDSSWVFQRDLNPQVALYSGRVPKTPLLRVEVAPATPRQ